MSQVGQRLGHEAVLEEVCGHTPPENLFRKGKNDAF